MTPVSRIVTIVLAATCVLVLGLWGLERHAEEGHRADMAAQRDAYLLRHLRTAAENYLATGLQLEQMHALQDVLEREQLAFGGILAIDVFNAAGTVLYSTDAGSRGTAVPGAWRELLIEDQSWSAEGRGQRQIGVRFDSDLGQAAGGIVITLSSGEAAPATLAQWYENSLRLLQWLVLALGAVVVAMAGVYWGLRRLGRPFQDAARALHGQSLPTQRAAHELVQAAARQRQAWDAERQRCRSVLQQLEELDHEA